MNFFLDLTAKLYYFLATVRSAEKKKIDVE